MDFNEMNDSNVPWDRLVVELHDAVIEDIVPDLGKSVGFVTASYEALFENNKSYKNTVVLIVNQHTNIQNQCGEDMHFGELKVGMTIDAVISAAMTMSIPPQSSAFSIMVHGE